MAVALLKMLTVLPSEEMTSDTKVSSTTPTWVKNFSGKKVTMEESSLQEQVHQAKLNAVRQVQWKDLPVEIKQYIMVLVPVESICKLCRVSKEFKEMAEDNTLWKALYIRDKLQWKHFLNPWITSLKPSANIKDSVLNFVRKQNNLIASFLKSTEDETILHQQNKEEHLNWKEMYMRQLSITKKPSSSEHPSIFDIKSKLSFSKKVHRVPLFGEGLEGGAAKGLLYQMMWNTNSPFTVSGMYPGVEGIGSGVGFVIGNNTINLAALYKYEDRGVFDKVRPLWREFFKTASGFVFVVDVRDDMDRVKEELHTFVNKEWTSLDCPLLVFSCHHTKDSDNWSAVTISEHLKLHEGDMRGREWCVCTVNTDTLEGIYDGLYWLSSKLH